MSPDPDPRTLQFDLPSSFEVLDHFVEEAESFYSGSVGNEDIVYRLVLLASEAVTNAIKHGNKLDPLLRVHVLLAVEPGRGRIVVRDEGEGFDSANVDDPLDAEHLMSQSGRGVFLMNEMADDVRWSDSGRRVEIIVNVP